MPPKTKGKAAATKGLPKSATNEKRAGSEKQATPDNGFLGQTFEQDNKRLAAFIGKLIKRLTYYGEDDQTINEAFTHDNDLPPPKLKKASATGSQPEDVDESNWLTKELEALRKQLTKCEEDKEDLRNRNREIDAQMKKYKHESEKQKNLANYPSARPRSAKHVLQTDSKNDVDTLQTSLQDHKDELKKAREEIAALQKEKASLDSKVKTPLYVAAIDLGTTYSGYAYSSTQQVDAIHLNKWHASAHSLLSHKAPTALLLNPDKTFHSFGFKAEDNFSQLTQEGSLCKDYYFFHNFKMLLHRTKKIDPGILLQDQTGKHLPAVDIFGHCIRFLKDSLLENINNSLTESLREGDVEFVLTIPAIWNENAKEFMKQAAAQAGISKDRLQLQLEPVAAITYCRQSILNRGNEREGGRESAFTKCMVADLGGGTADIALQKVCGCGSTVHVDEVSGVAEGGLAVNDAYLTFLKEMFGSVNMVEMQNVYLDDYLDMLLQFESKKRFISVSSRNDAKTSEVTFTMPHSLIELVKKDISRKSIERAVAQSPHAEYVHVKMNKSKISMNLRKFEELFLPTVRNIACHIDDILSGRYGETDAIVIVGGFAECDMVQSTLKKKFGSKRIVIPQEPGLAVLKGAVLLGHKSLK